MPDDSITRSKPQFLCWAFTLSSILAYEHHDLRSGFIWRLEKTANAFHMMWSRNIVTKCSQYSKFSKRKSKLLLTMSSGHFLSFPIRVMVMDKVKRSKWYFLCHKPVAAFDFLDNIDLYIASIIEQVVHFYRREKGFHTIKSILWSCSIKYSIPCYFSGKTMRF